MVSSTKLNQVGVEWELEASLDILRERRRAIKDAHRFRIAAAVLGGIGAGLVGLGWYGLETGSFGPVSGFWTAAGPILGTIVGFYFGKSGDDP